ncbi:D-alanyl-D-alanine carboxypeptidase family protein [Thermosediminibacter oceani]|uniref:serine-type D-Ala-D-Ala carboxypeptidase n=1 Tax=Thermosediminibacter oceani (strain ATCC BAA-1034 / DSM 16646 / JW/IW-1228P) TaxID=555079 RepID=D9S2B8_THEOJ|nr:D-alanyl-D-alanine carboxypeptidase family protein [Thermosediminibacter oceani]ADL07545.1 Serine-type D-Ala-D-Ala carboxypeptidase [Thermosediminibacter oceani DSM 16646]
MKRLICCKLILILILLIASTSKVTAAPSPPSIVGTAGILMDVKTGKVLYEKNAHLKLEPASTTKIMTTVIALEKGKLSDTVVTGREPTLADGTRIYLEEGEKLTLEQMLYGMMLNSGNDAAVAIAEHIAGSVPEFAKLMNEKAREIGAKNTNFVNPSGLPDKNHYTTAYDLALISRYALLNHPEFRKIVSTKTFKIPWQGKEWDRLLINHNKMLWRYEGTDGVKTGYTRSAGQTFVASATRNGWQLLAVVLKSQGRNIYSDAQALLDYGFDNFEKKDVINKGQIIDKIDVKYGTPVDLLAASDFTAVVEKGSGPIDVKKNIYPGVKAPVVKGQVLGNLDFYQGGSKIGSVALVAATDVPRKIYTRWWFWTSALIMLTYVPFRISVGIKRYKRHKQRANYLYYYKQRRKRW